MATGSNRIQTNGTEKLTIVPAPDMGQVRLVSTITMANMDTVDTDFTLYLMDDDTGAEHAELQLFPTMTVASSHVHMFRELIDSLTETQHIAVATGAAHTTTRPLVRATWLDEF